VSDSQELKDMECFIEICRQNNIEPMLVIVPFNGYWYDFMGVDKEQREELYESVRSLAEKYDVTYADLSDNEYELYYFEDNSHPALKGLVDINEKIYEFCKSAEG
jgi:D-alanine transfer protein